ncbi:MAG: hypothetical protein ACXWDI_16965 [Nocardioides sp.]
MSEVLEPCAFAPCERLTAATLRLVVEGEDLVLPVCDAHTKWLEGFADADDATRIIDLVPMEDSPQSDGEGPSIAGQREPPEHEGVGDVGGAISER